MSKQYPEALKYTQTHEWVKRVGDTLLLGVTAHAQEVLGAVVYVELPSADSRLKAGESFGVIESTKAVSELFAPVDGRVVKANDAVVSNPAAVNEDAYAAWLLEIHPDNAADVEGLLDVDAYTKLLEGAS